jgi:hypothetical protein
MLLTNLLLLPVALASSITIYTHPLPASGSNTAAPSPIPLAQITYDPTPDSLPTAPEYTGSISSYTPPSGSYTPDHLLRIGFTDKVSGKWRGVITSAASFSAEYTKRFVLHVDEKGEVYHVGFSPMARRDGGEETEVEVVTRGKGPQPALNRPVVLNKEGKIDDKEPEKTFLQK